MNITNRIKQLLTNSWQKYKKAKRRYQVLIPLSFVLLVGYIFCLPSPLFDVPYSTVVVDRRGELLGARIAKDQQWRFPTTDSVSEKYKYCLIEFEDKHFKRHWGINPVSIMRAFKQNISKKRIVSGASTITMQTIRLSRKEKRTFGEKVIELILASRLEFSYSKDEIIELYASHAPMGGNVVGIDAASWRYFGHSAKNLSWAEAATLAILPNSPSLMHFGRNREKLIAKRNRLLSKLHEQGMLDEVAYELASTEPLAPRPYPLPQVAPHLVTRLYLEQGGQYITSTLNKYRQEQVETILNRWNAEFMQNGINNLAALVIDVKSNEVIAYCGNVHFDKSSSANQVDIIQAPRSTGSILKPFLYNAMLQEGMILPDELVPDIPININGFAPKNFSLMYDGAAPASEALARSLNIPFVVSLRKFGVPKFYNLLKRSGMSTLNHSPDHYGLSLVLGGCEGTLWDVSNMYLQMVQSVQDFNNHDTYYNHPLPRFTIDDKKENLMEESRPTFSAGASWLTLQALANVNRPEEIDWRSIASMQKVAWKTGTSFGGRDGWAVGATADYVVAVWAGNSDGEGRPGLTGARTSGLVLFDIFNVLPKSQWFAKPTADLMQVEVCKESGLLKGLNCPESSIQNTWVTDKGAAYAEACSYHKLVHLSTDMRYQVYNDCAGDRGIVHTAWFILPPRWEWYYKEHHTDYKTLPPYSPECHKPENMKIMEFLYPFPNITISLPRQLDGTEGSVVFNLAHKNPSKRVYWHMDDKYMGETTNYHQIANKPQKGKCTLTAVDEDGNKINISFFVQ